MGNHADWVQLRDRTDNLKEYGLGWWTINLVEILNKIIESIDGKVDKNFWKYIFKYY